MPEEDHETKGGKIEALIERIPVMDGGARRRLTAGAIVALTVLKVSGGFTALSALVETKELSLPIVLLAAALLIYAIGMSVELIGEMFLIRPIGNALWGASRFKDWTPTGLSPRARNILQFFGAPLGYVVAVVFFFEGFGGANGWRILLVDRLSEENYQTFLTLDPSVREALEDALGPNAEFGRQALLALEAKRGV